MSAVLPDQPLLRSAEPGGTVVISSLPSDSHTWNLVFLQLLIEELGFDVVNLGPCVPDELLVSECRAHAPALVVLSSVNGHGYLEGRRVAGRLRACPELARTPIVLGGKLGLVGGESTERVAELLAVGFDAVYDDRPDGPAAFCRFVTARLGADRT
jgi:methylaspartate mutase sigma subunit